MKRFICTCWPFLNFTGFIAILINSLSSYSLAQNQNDTIIDFNQLLRGVKTLSMPSDQILPNGISLSDDAILKGQDSVLWQMSGALYFKAEVSDGEFYEITLSTRQLNGSKFVLIHTDKIEMATGWQKEGKIYVVVAVALVVFSAIVAFLVYLEKRLRKLEKNQVNE